MDTLGGKRLMLCSFARQVKNTEMASTSGSVNRSRGQTKEPSKQFNFVKTEHVFIASKGNAVAYLLAAH